MDKETLSNYGWIVICVLILAVMLAFATPFGNFIANGFKATYAGFGMVGDNALGVVIPGSSGGEENGTPTPEPIVGCATFTDGVTLTWEELKLAENGTKYNYDASKISDTEIGENAFFESYDLVSITLPSTLTTIGDYAFYASNTLTTVVIPEGLTAIGNHVFSYCDFFTNITLPSTLTTIGDGAFSSLMSMESISIPEGVITIGQNIFFCSPCIKNITLPSTLTTIGDRAFYGCATNLTINFAGTQEQWEAFGFSYVPPDAVINYTSE